MSFISMGSADPGHVGTKAANLARLASLPGVHVPPHFAVAAGAFAAVAASSAPLIRSLAGESADSPRIAELAAAVQDRIQAAELPQGLRADIIGAYQALSRCYGEEDSPVSVRSSATAEDGAKACYAGQYCTRLNVRGARAVLAAVRAVWCSAYGAQALRYRKRQGDTGVAVGMGVIVQRMVDAVAAGTLYTVDPETGASMICVNAVPGLGVLEVAGEHTPTSWVIDPRTYIVIKRRMPPSGVPPLGPAKLQELARQVVGVALWFRERWGVATLELEYAVDARGGIAFLQVRPETVWGQGRASLTAVDIERAAYLDRLYAGGTTGSPGVVAGTLRAVGSLAEAEAQAAAGDILLTPNTSNVWEQLFTRIGGIITAVGGSGSHTAVVMRELGKPALVGARGAMEALASHRDRPITLDATQRLVFAGLDAAGTTRRLDSVAPVFGGPEDEWDDDLWKNATSQPGRTVTDAAGVRWIFKPEYPLCRFTQAVLLEAHRWMARRLGVRVGNEIQGAMHRMPFADLLQWQARLGEMGLDDLERLQREREAALTAYLDASERFVLEPTALHQWLSCYVQVNAFIGLGFSLYKATERLLESALARARIREPYHTQMRLADIGLGESETRRAARSLQGLVEQARADQGLTSALAAACARQDEEPLKVRGCEHFYQGLVSHALSFKVTPVAEIDLPRCDAVLAAAAAVRGAMIGGQGPTGAVAGFSSEADVEFFPQDDEPRRTLHLALRAERSRQDAHHLRVRGHWWVHDDLRELAGCLIAAGKLSGFAELFDHPPAWLLDQLDGLSGARAAERSVCHVR